MRIRRCEARRAPWLSGALVIGLGLANVHCGARRIQAYEGAKRPASELAVLRSHRNLVRWVMIEGIDGRPVPSGKMRAQEISLTPGSHTVSVSLAEGDTQSTSNATVAFSAEAGRRYRVHGESVKEGFWKELQKNTVGGRGHWVAWIEEEPSGTVVGGKKPTHGMYNTTLE